MTERLWPRRRILGYLAAAGIGSLAFHRALVTVAAEQVRISPQMIDQAEWVAGIDLTDEERELMVEGINSLLEDYARLRQVPLDNAVSPALRFEVLEPSPDCGGRPLPGLRLDERTPPLRPESDLDLAFAPVSQLAQLLRSRQVSSVELTRLYLDRLRRHDPALHCVITLTEERALREAETADRLIAAGRYLGPLHGVPWGAKDLLAAVGYPTTWGAKPFESQVIDRESAVSTRLRSAGAVLLAKLSVGALAWGDVWYGGMTRNPWNVEQGSSGSSAGPAAATSAGLVGFSIGTETWGSIVSPCTRCGVTGLRPTFGRVSRQGAMALSWSMDKIGPMTRSVEDCAIVLDAIHGPDGLDPTVVDRPFSWPLERDVRTVRVGYVRSQFEEDRAAEDEDEEERARSLEWQRLDRATLDALREIDIDPVPIELPDSLPVDALSFILTAEAATAFDELTRSGRDDQLVRQVEQAWPNVFRQGQLITAVEYLRANRVRRRLMEQMEELMAGVDVYVSPTFGGSNLLLTNLTGHPQVVLPNGFRESDGTPTSITFTGRLFGETELLAVAHAYQQSTGFHLRRPPGVE